MENRQLSDETMLNLKNQYPKLYEDFNWFFKKLNSKKGVFMRSNEEINRAIEVHNNFLNFMDLVLNVYTFERGNAPK